MFLSVDCLVVAGGGAGGYPASSNGSGGGGGAGGFQAVSGHLLEIQQSLPVTVGAGGASTGASGADSILDTITSTGGGGGGTQSVGKNG
ncbi:hypothetical protein MNBD_CPR01-269, partial [hydrothermal vent metagenome]